MRYEELSSAPIAESEDKVSAYWDEIDLLKRSIETRDEDNEFVFFEGPPTANGKPGWDTHGLPVEIEVEKKLGLESKQEIEEYGIEKFNKACRDSVFEYEALWRQMSHKMGYLIDLDNPYITLDNNYIETVWWILDKMHKDGLIYEGHKVLPYCPRCGTGLASHEVAQGYKEIKTNTLIAKFKLKNKENEYFLAWTTTPWTLAANVALAVSPKEIYLRVKQNDEIYYVAKTLAEKVISSKGEYEVLEELSADKLEYMEYEQLMPFLETKKKAFFVTLADYVTTDDGTGIVHIAPAFGEDDYNVGLKYDLPVLNPVDDEGKYISTPWKGRFVMEEDPEKGIDLSVDIIKYLAAEDKIYSKEKMEHNYPHCWRCQTPLIYYARPSWYIRVTDYKDKLIENNNGVNWFPNYVGEKRFGNWLENLNDWAISRSRYWGTPLNIWVCDDCNHQKSIGSRKELAELAQKEISEDIELHRPYVDEVIIKCEKCGSNMHRVKDVIDCWFDSGSMPFAQWHYPFENEDIFEKSFPADFICEGIDQTRGWFYSLLSISTFVTGKSPYKNVLVNDLILDKEGKKMSKSRGNTVDPFEMFDTYGADALRWYLMYVSPAWTPTRFDMDGIKEVQSKFFNTLKNIYNFFILYANTDDLDIKSIKMPVENRSELDRWLISKYNNLIKNITEYLDDYDANKATREIQDFINEEFSNWYIRRSRRRFWGSDMTDDKKSVYLTTYEVLLGIVQMAAPIAPFLSEEIFKKLTDEESVHLSKYPEYNGNFVDLKLENKMDTVKNLVSLGRAAREEAKIKVRQPISKAVISNDLKELIGDLDSLIIEELNIKEIEFSENISEFMNYSLKPNFQTLGKKLGSKIKPLQEYLKTEDAGKIVSVLNKDGKIGIELDGEIIDFLKEDFLIEVNAKEGYDVQAEGNLFIALDTTLNEELISEGFAREFISKVQQMRKSNNYDMMDKIRISCSVGENLRNAIEKHREFICYETLSKGIEFVDNCSSEDFDLNGENAKIELENLTK